ncbi:MAG: S-layer family protein, partial [Verrucomicrobia bacterium]|nr:S-layer family protein [Verrucomicrobiota bacterium]
GPVTLSGSSGFSFVGNNLSFASPVQTALNGPTSIQVAGTLLIPAVSIFSLDGAFTVSGAGSTQIGGSITTTNDTITFNTPVTLLAAISLNTGSGIGNIVFGSTVDGAVSLSLTAGIGNVVLGGALGGGARIGAFTINSATNIDTVAITATSINLASSGTATINGNLNTTGALGITLSGNNITTSGNVITTNSGPYTVTNTGVLNAVYGGSSLLSGAYTQSGATAVNLAGTLATNNGNITFGSPLALTNNTVLSTGVGNGNILFSSTLDGTYNLTLTGGTGNITFTGAVGSLNELATLTINSAFNVTAQAITAKVLTQLSGATNGKTLLQGPVTTDGALGISLTSYDLTIEGNVTTTGGGPLTIQNDGVFTLGTGVLALLDGAFSQIGIGSNTLAGSITSNGAISFVGAINLTGNTTLNSSSGNHDILLGGLVNSTVTNNFSLTLAAGSGNITLQQAVGNTKAIGALTFTSASTLTTQAISAVSILQSAGTSTTFNGALTTTGASGIQTVGGIFNYNGAVTTGASGPLIITNSGILTIANTVNLSGGFTQNGAGVVRLNGSITTNNQTISLLRNITLLGNTALNSGPGIGNITSGGTVNGAFNFTLTAGTGNITLSSSIGGSTALVAFSIVSANNVTTGAISSASILQTSGGGTTIFNGALSTTGLSGIALTGSAFEFLSTTTTTMSGPVTVNNSGVLTISGAMNIEGSFTQTGSGSVSLGANITVSNQTIAIATPITLIDAVILDSGSGVGAIAIASSIDGAQTLDLEGGVGSVSVGGTIGGISPLTSLTITGSTISLADIGSGSEGVTGLVSAIAAGDLIFTGAVYNTNEQDFIAQTIKIQSGSLTTFTTSGDPVALTATTIELSLGSDLTINTAGGAITLSPLEAISNDLRTVILNAGTGQITVASIDPVGNSEFA